MIRALLMTKWSKSVAGPMVTTWNYPTLHHLNAHTVRPRAVSLNPDRSFSAEGGSDDKPKNVPHGFVAPGFPSTSSPLGSNPGNNTRKDVPIGEVQTPSISIVTSGGKLGRAEPLDSIVRSKGTSNDDKKSEAQKKASEAKEAAAKQLQDVMANLPSKEQTEKYFFRVVAFFYDLTYLTCTWLLNFVEHNIVRNATVQHYWKRFHEKMEQAKKD
ncbi:uncharacterized protein LOC6533250 isoform X1 [Drosophila yakuba]|uniref:Uncharacterized protein, isoform A n=1 Tax=Drosophila yakuba TaxID=7245 RepID=B4PJT9_DROYA|nr:uncharacterized protein LOC6533250 isoform X1 [Drosophila yakuba]EDW93688.1 uncharacterized protein Dyak_GE20455, isoform A [Drosophila yakuba]